MNPLRLASLAASPLLLAQKGEVTVASRFPWPFGWTLHSLGSRLRGNDGGFGGGALGMTGFFAGMTWVRARNDVSCARSLDGRGMEPLRG